MKAADVLDDFFLTPSFDEADPVNSIMGLNFVSGFKTSDDDKSGYLEKIRIPKECRNILSRSIKKIYNHLSEECGLLRVLKAYRNVSAGAWSSFFGRPPLIKPYGSIGKNSDPAKTLVQFRDVSWPVFVHGYDYFKIANLLCHSVPPREGQAITRNLISEAKEKEVVKIYRLVSRAEDDLIPYLGQILQKNVKVEIHNAGQHFLEEVTRKELELLSPNPKDRQGLLSELRRIFCKEYMDRLNKYLSSLGTPKDPIYCIRVDKDLKMDSDPHFLGNMITKFSNLCSFMKLFQERGVDLRKEERLRIYEYRQNPSFRGTVICDQNERIIRKGIFVLMVEEGPGRLSVLCPISNQSERVHVQAEIKAIEENRVAYESNNELVETLCETKEIIKKLAENIRGKSSDVKREEQWYEDLKKRVLDLKVPRETANAIDLLDLRARLNALYFRVPSIEKIERAKST